MVLNAYNYISVNSRAKKTREVTSKIKLAETKLFTHAHAFLSLETSLQKPVYTFYNLPAIFENCKTADC